MIPSFCIIDVAGNQLCIYHSVDCNSIQYTELIFDDNSLLNVSDVEWSRHYWL